MRKLITGAALLALAVPAAALADDSPPAQVKSAAALCRAQRDSLNAVDKAAFATLYGTKHNAFGKCVSAMAKARKAGTAAKKQQAVLNAAKSCKAERAADAAAFAAKYGTNANKRNAFGKCVSTLAKHHGQTKANGNTGKPSDTGKPDSTPGNGPKS